MTAKKTLYLANPYGFSAQQRGGPLQELVGALESMGADVWEPFARSNQIDRASAGWAYRIGQADLRDVREADGLFAVVNGCPPDEGVMVELGLAIAWEKPVFLFRDDFRRCTDSEVYPLNLMLFTGLPAVGWEAAWYGSLEEIADPGKALARWLRHDRPSGSASAEADPIISMSALTAGLRSVGLCVSLRLPSRAPVTRRKRCWPLTTESPGHHRQPPRDHPSDTPP